MKQARQLLTLAFCCLASLTAMAQNTQSVILGVTSSQNVTLDANCSATIVPQILLNGDFDADGDGVDVPFDAFQVEILGPDMEPVSPSTNVITAPGEYMVLVTLASTDQVGFTGNFDIDGANAAAGADANASIESDGTTLTFVSRSLATDPSDMDNATVDFTFVEDGTVSFTAATDFAAGSSDALLAMLFEGELVSSDVTPDASGVYTVDVVAGDMLRLGIMGDGVAGQDSSTVSFSDFVFAPADAIVVEGFNPLMGMVVAQDKTAPILVTEVPPFAGELLCADLDANNVNAIPSLGAGNVRCFRVDAQTGEIVPGSIDPRLADALSAQTFDDTTAAAPRIPTFFDGCASMLQVCVSDVVTQEAGVEDGCGTQTITRTFRANEITGMTASGTPIVDTDDEVVTTTTIEFERLTLANLDLTNFQRTVEPLEPSQSVCASEAIALQSAPSDADFPELVSTVDGRVFSSRSAAAMCSNLNASFSNGLNPTRACEFTYKFQRTYSIFDWCDDNTVLEFTQNVKIGDIVGPIVEVPGATGDAPIFATNQGTVCAAMVRLDGAGVSAVDACSGADVELTVSIFPDGDETQAPFGAYTVDLTNGTPEMSDALPVGDYTFRYTATDECGNTTVVNAPFSVVDASGPVAICEDGLNVSLSCDADDNPISATITPDQVDKGSYDDCSGDDVTYQIARSNSMSESFQPDDLVFGDAVVFDATDVNQPRFLTLEVTDDQLNSNYCWLPVLIENKCGGDAAPCVAPTPACSQSFVATLAGVDNPSITVLASQLISARVLDCRGLEVTDYAVVRANMGPAAKTDVSLVLTCADAGDFVPVEVYAFDANGNDPLFCTTMIGINTDNVDCTDGVNLVGAVVTNEKAGMRNVQVTLTGSSDMDEMQMTDEAGVFAFQNLPLGGDYTVTPTYEEAVNLQEVKISDVVAISAVILGTADFASPYDYLAADVDQSKSLNVLDMVAIQRVILGLDDNFSTNQSWGFVPADVVVENPYTSAFPNVYNANDLRGNILDADFVAFAYGNVTGEGRTAMNIEVADAELAAGEAHTIEIAAGDLAGFQGTIELAAGLELVNADFVGEGAMNAAYAAEGVVAVALRGEATLSLDVIATEAVTISEAVSLTDAITVREAVAANGNSGSLNLTFSAVEAGEFVTGLGNATPNPVVESTQINFTLATAGEVTLSVQDIQGRTIMVRNLDAAAGANNTTVSVAELNGASGILTYTLTAENFSATKKMVVVAR